MKQETKQCAVCSQFVSLPLGCHVDHSPVSVRCSRSSQTRRAHEPRRAARQTRWHQPRVRDGQSHPILTSLALLTPIGSQPNLTPPLTTPAMAVAYLAELHALAPETHFLPSLYLTSALTPALIREAKASGIYGVKSYPRGVTTNSEGGVGMEGYAAFDAVFGEMEKVDLVLNLHGEVPSDLDGDVSLILTVGREGTDEGE
jgi:hypothetical protein